MIPYITLRSGSDKELPEQFRNEDERFAEELVEVLLEEYTEPGDKVIDIFAGFGTTLVVAERMGRIGYGMKIDSGRFEYAKSQIKHKENLIQMHKYSHKKHSTVKRLTASENILKT